MTIQERINQVILSTSPDTIIFNEATRLALKLESNGDTPDDYLPIVELMEKAISKKALGALKSETMAALLARPQPQLEWLIKDLWVDKARGLIAGNPGIGKTWLALDMLLSVSSGQPCLGRFLPRAKLPVLLVEEESSLMNLERRVHSMARGRALPDNALTNFHHMTRQFIKIVTHEKELTAFIKSEGIALVVFDSLRRFHSVDENSSEKMQPILDAFARLNIETGASIVLIHHLAKQTADKGGKKAIFERMRGTSDLWAWRDCIIGMEGEEEATDALCSFQFRDAESPLPIHVKRVIDPDSGAIVLESLEVEETEDFSTLSGEILEFVKTQFGGATRNLICKSVAGRKQDKLQVLKRMEKLGTLVKSGFKLVVPD